MLAHGDKTEDEIEIFTKEIKNNQLIYVENGWAIYSERMMSISNTLKSISLRILKTNLSNVDIKIGLISIVPSVHLLPDQVKFELKKPLLQETLKSLFSSSDLHDVHLEWNLEPIAIEDYIKHYRVFKNDKFIGTTRNKRYFDKKIDLNEVQSYRVEVISKRDEVIASGQITELIS